METAIYYVLCAMTLGGALGVILARGYVNAAMSMLLSMLGAAGMMIMMGAYFVAFIMVSVYAGAVLVLFVFVVMLSSLASRVRNCMSKYLNSGRSTTKSSGKAPSGFTSVCPFTLFPVRISSISL